MPKKKRNVRPWKIEGCNGRFATKDAAIAAALGGKYNGKRVIVDTTSGARYDLLGHSIQEIYSSQWGTLVGKYVDLVLYLNEPEVPDRLAEAVNAIGKAMGSAFLASVRRELTVRASVAKLRQKRGGAKAKKEPKAPEPKPPEPETEEELMQKKIVDAAAEKLAEKLLRDMM